MSNLHNAKELADFLDFCDIPDAAAELRRLEAENQNLTEAVWDGNRQIEQLREAKAELLEALERLAKLGNGNEYGNSDGNMIARAAIQKHGGQA